MIERFDVNEEFAHSGIIKAGDFYYLGYNYENGYHMWKYEVWKGNDAISFMLETKYNFNVLQCVYNSKYLDISDSELKALEQAHFRKIELSDAIYVIDLNGYIGEQVTKEIAYAKGLGKEIFYNSTFANGYTN